ncbi:MAG: hypothetical protein M1438_20240 [Deltaproteobacteria bacterium]|nr:hypothetical protein [Deltaproteobacteria bacterium]
MLGLNLLIRLSRSVLKGPVTDAGLLPAKVYRHLVLEAMEDDDFPGALDYLQWAEDRLLAQMLVLRLRLLAARHDRQRRTILELLEGVSSTGVKPVSDTTQRAVLPEKYRHLLEAEDQALKLLAGYEARALSLMAAAARQVDY